MKKILIAGDHSILREALKRLLLVRADIDRIGEANDSREVMKETFVQ